MKTRPNSKETKEERKEFHDEIKLMVGESVNLSPFCSVVLFQDCDNLADCFIRCFSIVVVTYHHFQHVAKIPSGVVGEVFNLCMKRTKIRIIPAVVRINGIVDVCHGGESLRNKGSMARRRGVSQPLVCQWSDCPPQQRIGARWD
jgi:hypothetical protein